MFTRYVLRSPLVWSDELATILFLWLAMLGSVVAYRRGEHIRLSVLVRRASPRVRRDPGGDLVGGGRRSS